MRKLGRFTKDEILEAEARFLEGQSIYKIGREMKRKQRPIKLHLFNLGLMSESALGELNTEYKEESWPLNSPPNYIDLLVLSFLLIVLPSIGLYYMVFLVFKSI